MTLLFITGNKDKLREVQELIPGVQRIDLDLPEIQEVGSHKVIAAKIVEARKYHSGALRWLQTLTAPTTRPEVERDSL